MLNDRLGELAQCIHECAFTSIDGKITPKQAIKQAQQLLLKTKKLNGIVYVIGNGGSAGVASHFSNDLMKSRHIPSQTLYDTNLLTCLANDIGYENAFSFSLQRLLKPCDLLVAISSSGQSQNILNAVDVARSLSTPIITLSGFAYTNPLRTLGVLNFWIDRKDYGLVETAHFFILHSIVDCWKQQADEHVQDHRCAFARKN